MAAPAQEAAKPELPDAEGSGQDLCRSGAARLQADHRAHAAPDEEGHRAAEPTNWASPRPSWT
ncbi:MAG: hypothetical protein MZW92_05085 [Comamonadaceae bacterium]|nr:hypothetical protein [Comamonadaceae bacterium]